MFATHRIPTLLPGILMLAVACTTAQADGPVAQSAVLTPTCEDVYDVIGTVHDGEETESIDRVVFTDSAPFECELARVEQLVDFNFNGSSTDTVTGCTYTIVRKHKATGTTVAATETLGYEHPQLHYRVIATPQSSDPDCNGLPVIDVDPKVQISWGTGKSNYQ